MQQRISVRYIKLIFQHFLSFDLQTERLHISLNTSDRTMQQIKTLVASDNAFADKRVYVHADVLRNGEVTNA